MAARLPRPGSLLTGHRTKKTKHMSQQKQWAKEKRPKEEPIEAEEAPAEKEQGGDNNSDNSSTHEAQPKVQPKKPKQGKKKAKLDPFVRITTLQPLIKCRHCKRWTPTYSALRSLKC